MQNYERVVFTKEWLDDIEGQVNAYALNAINEAKSRYTTFMLDFKGHGSWSMEVATRIAGMKPQQVKKITPIENFINDKGDVSKQILCDVASPCGRFMVSVVLYWDSTCYQTVGILIPLSQYALVAESTEYKIEIACSKGMREFSCPFVVWYYNDSKKSKGEHKVPSLPLDVGSCNYMLHTCSKGFGSDPLMTLNGTEFQWSFDLKTWAEQNGNPNMVFNFWGD